MGITHVIRAEEWLSSLPKHVRLYEGFGWEPPVFCHLPLLRNADRSKISKRKNPVSLNFYRRAGYLPEALLNYLALMGWAMPDEREEFTLEEFVDALHPRADLARRAGLRPREAQVAEREVPPAALAAGAARAAARPSSSREDHLLRGPAPRAGADRHARGLLRLRRLLLHGRGRLRRRGRCKAMVPKGRAAGETAKSSGRSSRRSSTRSWTGGQETLEAALRRFGEKAGWAPKELFMTVRVATTGRAASPPLFETLAVLGQGDLPAPAAARRRALKSRKRRPMSTDTPAAGERERADFIREIIGGGPAQRQARRRSSPASRPSPTATCTSATPSRSA